MCDMLELVTSMKDKFTDMSSIWKRIQNKQESQTFLNNYQFIVKSVYNLYAFTVVCVIDRYMNTNFMSC